MTRSASPAQFTLDDLFDGPEERPPARRPPQRAALWAVKAGLGAAALAGALVAVLRVAGYGLPYPVALAGFLALLTLHRLVAMLEVTRVGRLGGDPGPAPDHPDPDQLVNAVQRWQTRLSWGRAGIRPFTRSSPLLGELVEERLRLRHGVTMSDDPARARTLVGERLWSYLADPAAPTPAPRDLATLLSDVEKL